MTNIDQFEGNLPCPKIDALDIDAFFRLEMDPINDSTLRLVTSWGCTAVNLSTALTANETITHLFLTPADNPTALQYNREDYGKDGAPDGGVDCITGDALSRIISMHLLRDVSQSKPLVSGDVYMWNSINNLFEPFNLQNFVDNTNKTLQKHDGDINNLKSQVSALQLTVQQLQQQLSSLGNRLTTIENAIFNWGADKTTPIARGNINIYGGTSTGVDKSKYIATHDTNTNVTGDQYFA